MLLDDLSMCSPVSACHAFCEAAVSLWPFTAPIQGRSLISELISSVLPSDEQKSPKPQLHYTSKAETSETSSSVN